MNALFVELPAFERYRQNYLDDAAFRDLQQFLMANPRAGNVIKDCGGLRKLRFADTRRQKGKRSGIRIIYYWWDVGAQFWLFTLYGKDELLDLSKAQKMRLQAMLNAELMERGVR